MALAVEVMCQFADGHSRSCGKRHIPCSWNGRITNRSLDKWTSDGIGTVENHNVRSGVCRCLQKIGATAVSYV